jgi:uncharacterized RDD family membrane protein YckC
MNEQQYAGFWIRLAATLIDVIILLFVIGIPLTLIYGEAYWTSDTLYFGIWDVLLNYVLPFVATIWFWLRFLGTPGKMLVKIKIVDANTGNKMSVGQAIGRYFAYIISSIPFGLGFIWIAFDKKKQGWHDKLAGTVVIK